MNPEVTIVRKPKQHLLPLSLRANQGSAHDAVPKRGFIESTQNVFPRVQPNPGYLISDSGIPLIAVPLDFG
jgi:hypothetical protein